MAAGLQGQGGSFGEPRMSLKASRVPTSQQPWCHLPRGWFLKCDGFGAAQSWNCLAVALWVLCPPKIPPYCIDATCPTSPHKFSTPSPLHLRGHSTTFHRGCTAQFQPYQPYPPRPQGRAVPRRGQRGHPGDTAAGHGDPGERLGRCQPPRRCAAAAFGRAELVRSALGARQGWAHRRHSAPRPCLSPSP